MIKYTQDQKNQVVELRQQGLGYQDIAGKVGIYSLSVIQEVCARAGIDRKPNPKYISYPSELQINNYFVLGEIHYRKIYGDILVIYWKCRCACGKIFELSPRQRRKNQKSCGCLTLLNRFRSIESKVAIGNNRYSQYIDGADRRHLLWDLSKEKFIELLFGDCYYCGSPPSTLVKSQNHKELVSGVDRLDSHIGYTIDNCVSCCKICNRAKGDATLSEFIDWLAKVKST